ncbi:hypothetical protein [Halorubrum halodurans]|uniref:Uncharacterized protein n=1 Tax=Halorubrum halodurans TaxID=1383851 RepID=A0A256IPP8_9EURY|nr:hypothetical protein [Halorubrum halodurans]OYR58501.1 hypothetical protein DJ70_02995 [Halorubrum halodurans]
MNRRTPRTYTYRISVDDNEALRKLHYFEALHDDYWITKLDKKRNVPNAGSVRHWGHVFYQSREHYDYDQDEMVGGAISGLHDCRYSLEWRPFPNDSLLEMRNANEGGTRIRGERHVGFSDPRLSDYVPIDTVVPWTPTEIEAMFDGDSVPDKVNYTHNAPEIAADTARDMLRGELETAKRVGIEQAYQALRDFVDDCDHNHVLETDRKYGDVAYCEDCGRGWERDEFEWDCEHDELTIVGSA